VEPRNVLAVVAVRAVAQEGSLGKPIIALELGRVVEPEFEGIETHEPVFENVPVAGHGLAKPVLDRELEWVGCGDFVVRFGFLTTPPHQFKPCLSPRSTAFVWHIASEPPRNVFVRLWVCTAPLLSELDKLPEAAAVNAVTFEWEASLLSTNHTIQFLVCEGL
jgi:hypothetical protein